jgi:hypothetical protein
MAQWQHERHGKTIAKMSQWQHLQLRNNLMATQKTNFTGLTAREALRGLACS